MRIVLCYPLQQRHLDQIHAAAPDAEIVNAGQERIAEEILAADLFCGHPKVPTPWEEVVRLNRLKWIQSSAAGTDHLQLPSIIQSPIIITNISGVLANQVTEQAMSLLLGLIRSLPTFFRAQQAREYIRRPVRDLHGSTVGIVGLGGVGRRVAEVLSAFKTRILATDLFPIDKPPQVESLWSADRLDELLPLVDIVVLCVPLTAETRGMIDARRLALMRPGSILINVARGPVVIEHDLVAAIESGHLRGRGRRRCERAAAGRQQVVESAERHYQPTRRRRKCPPSRRHHRLLLREPPPLSRRAAAPEPDRQAPWLPHPPRNAQDVTSRV